MDPAKAIAERNRRRHSHHTRETVDFCDNCGSFVNKGKPDTAGRVRYTCGACGRAHMEYRATP